VRKLIGTKDFYHEIFYFLNDRGENLASEDELDELIREYFRELRKELCDSTDRIILLKILARDVDRCWRLKELAEELGKKSSEPRENAENTRQSCI